MGSVIKAENLSKAYQLGDFGTGTISRDLERFVARLRGKEDPFLKIGEVNDRTSKGVSDIVWSLKDINFEIGQGDAVGIIGRNGAGKSTLLKILSRVTFPTTGVVKIKGRVASLLEVGTGFHPELSGRENIYLNGAILGMRKAEITRKFDEIVDFAGVERYVDTPVKRYSSGMYVRLAFAVAAHLEAEILVVDEVLAVGDAEFQKKCLGKMGQVSRGEGRTVLFVSHNMDSVKTLCSKGILLDKGSVVKTGEITGVTNYYFNSLVSKENKGGISAWLAAYKRPDVEITAISVNDQRSSVIMTGEMLQFDIQGVSVIDSPVDVEIYIIDPVSGKNLFFASLYYTEGITAKIEKGRFLLLFDVKLPENIFSGTYNLNILVSNPGIIYYYRIEEFFKIDVTGRPCASDRQYSIDNGAGYAFMEIENFCCKNHAG